MTQNELLRTLRKQRQDSCTALAYCPADAHAEIARHNDIIDELDEAIAEIVKTRQSQRNKRARQNRRAWPA